MLDNQNYIKKTAKLYQKTTELYNFTLSRTNVWALEQIQLYNICH